MCKSLSIKTFIFILWIFLSFPAAGQKPKHVILISIDGFRPEFYLDPSWPAPNIQQMVKNGVYAEAVRSVFPSVTYPSHTTMITGAFPGKHGINHNIIYDSNGAWYYYEEDIKTETLWDAAKKKELTTAAVIWPVSVGAPIDYNIPVIRPVKGQDETQLSLTRKLATPKGIMDEVELYATGKLTPQIFNNKYLLMDENISRIGTWLIEKHKPELTALHFISVDHFAHAEGRDGDKVRQAVAVTDRAVGSVLEAVERAGLSDKTAILITGDHGFVNSRKRFNPNILLNDAGLLDGDKWRARFEPTGGAALLYLKNENDRKTLRKVIKMLEKLPEAQKSLFRIVERKELDEIGTEKAVALAITGVDGVVFGGAKKGDLITGARGGSHGFFPDTKEIHTGFIGYGAGLKKGGKIKFMGLEDIAPIISELLNLGFDAPDGKLPYGVLEDELLK